LDGGFRDDGNQKPIPFVLAPLPPGLPVRAQQAPGANDQPIHDAARLGSGREVAAILTARPGARNVRTARGQTPLYIPRRASGHVQLWFPG